MKNILTIAITTGWMLFSTFTIGQNKHDTIAYVTIAGIKGEGKLTIEKLLAAGKIELSDNKLTLLHYDMSATVKDANMQESITTTSSKSLEFTNEMKAMIKNLPLGKKLYIESVEAKRADGTIVKLPGLILKIE